jgi:hypothetical protein
LSATASCSTVLGEIERLLNSWNTVESADDISKIKWMKIWDRWRCPIYWWKKRKKKNEKFYFYKWK